MPRDQDDVAARQGGAERRVVLAADVAVGQVELAQPGLGADGVDEVEADDLHPGLGQYVERLAPVRRPEGERVVLVGEERGVVDGDENGVLRLVTHAAEDVPVVVVDVLERGVPLGARERERNERRRRGDAEPAQELFLQPLQSPTYTNAAQKNGCAREKWKLSRV
jgi:hypothetical protein